MSGQNALVRNAADPEQVKEAEGKAKRGREREISDVAYLLQFPQFRRFVWRYLEPLDRISAQQSGSWTYFAEGERNQALKIKADIIEANPQALVDMMIENKEK